MKRAFILAVSLVSGLGVAGETSGQSDGVEVLGEGSFWRFHAGWRTPASFSFAQFAIAVGPSAFAMTAQIAITITSPSR